VQHGLAVRLTSDDNDITESVYKPTDWPSGLILPAMSSAGERTIPNSPDLYAFRRIYDLVCELFGDSEKDALDYGCGTGYGTAILATAFRSIVGVDVSENAIAYCIGAYKVENLRFKRSNPGAQPFPDKSFDRIFSFQVFEHILPDAAPQYLLSIWNMLRPGGICILTTPKAENYYGGYSGNPFHLKEYTRLELQQVLAETLSMRFVRIRSLRDVPSTRLRNGIRRYGRNSLPAKMAARILADVVRRIEPHGPAAHRNILRDNDRAIGSYYIEIEKPVH
jgi:SAM-dependent methyltransferase